MGFSRKKRKTQIMATEWEDALIKHGIIEPRYIPRAPTAEEYDALAADNAAEKHFEKEAIGVGYIAEESCARRSADDECYDRLIFLRIDVARGRDRQYAWLNVGDHR